MDKIDAGRPNDSMSRLRIALIYYSAFSSFIKNDYEILSRHFDVFKFNIQSAKDIFSLMAAISKILFCIFIFH